MYKSILSRYFKARGLNVNIVMTSQFYHGTWYKEPFSSMCIECGKSNATQVEEYKHILFHTMESNPVVTNVQRHLHQSLSLAAYKKLLLG